MRGVNDQNKLSVARRSRVFTAQTDQPAVTARLSLVIGLLHLGHAQDKLYCSDCLLVAKALQSELLAVEPGHGLTNSAREEGVVPGSRRGRLLAHPRSEIQIFEALDKVCNTVERISDHHLSSACKRLIHPHRDSLENHIYAEGLEHVREILCTQLTGLCPKHTLHDSGEL
ncbi:hypothetical protein WJX84_001972 [Apatococcus fuscideae]|uniref:Saposin B-type domain-containing protein n=1 Tax=Apatococcus fuscideae TaxID=2026836 RepID=A0AAW1TGA6_9CHLO